MISILFQHLGLIVLESELDVDLVFISIIKRRGMRILVYFSIPFWMPDITIEAVRTINTRNQMIGLHEPSLKDVNISLN